MLARSLLVVLGLASAACAVPASAQEQPPSLRVAASTPIVADIAAHVGGARTEVFSVVPPGADPHTWEAGPQDLVRLSRAQSFIYLGNALERFLEAGAPRRAVRDARVPELRLVDALSEHLIRVDLVIDHGDHVHDLRDGDPHVWLDPRLGAAMADAVASHLSEVDPAGAEAYVANARAYRAQLLALDEEIQRELARIPPERRRLVVMHDAFRYFAARYEFEILGFVVQNPGADPAAGDVAELSRQIGAAGVPVAFKEPQYNAAILERLAEDHGVAVGELLTDTFAGRVDSYIDLLRFNANSLVSYLGD
jgi:ABC-type Zn uptake system ZnuABC Zn-binding protein ZnuA